jgi:hypothetical protein
VIESRMGHLLRAEVPPRSEYEKEKNTWEGEKILDAGDVMAQVVDVTDIYFNEAKAIEQRTLLLFFHGRFVYRDIFSDARHETGFFVQYDPETKTFSEVERPGYNYQT